MLNFIPASLYETLYLAIVTILTVVLYSRYRYCDGTIEYYHERSDLKNLLLVLLFALFIGLRPLSGKYFVDMVNLFFKTEFDKNEILELAEKYGRIE